MKKIKFMALASVAMMLFASCQKTIVTGQKNEIGYLSFGEFSLGLNEEVETKATTAASGTYVVNIYDAEGELKLSKTYAEILNTSNTVSLPAGNYTLVARSSDLEVPTCAFEQPIYGVTHSFSIAAGQTTNIGELVCTLVQCKVTVSYSDEFLASVTGAGSTKVTLTAGYPLEYALNANKTYNQNAGYFAVNGNTMEVVFSGSIDGKNQKMTKTFAGIAARQWRQIKFIKQTNAEGNATFDIVINQLLSDATLNNVVDVPAEVIIGEDPNKPKGDGNITLMPAAGCDQTITYNPGTEQDGNGNLIGTLNIPIAPLTQEQINANESTMNILLKASVPGGVKKFSVNIQTDNTGFAAAVEAANATNLDLINPLPEHDVIFKVVPFPHGADLLGKTEVDFDLSAAQPAIVNYKGNHLFTMTTVDNNGCTKIHKVTMVVE